MAKLYKFGGIRVSILDEQLQALLIKFDSLPFEEYENLVFIKLNS